MHHLSKARVIFGLIGILTLVAVLGVQTPLLRSGPNRSAVLPELESVFRSSDKALAAGGQTYYAAPTGSDSNPGTSALPFRTIARGITAAAAGDTIILKDGTYPADTPYGGGSASYWLLMIDKSGTPTAPITLKAEHKHMAILDCGNVFNAAQTGCDGYILIRGGVSNWVFQDLVFTREYGSGMIFNDITAAHDILVKGNLFTEIGRHADDSVYGFTGVYANGTQYNLTFDGNEFTNIGRTASNYTMQNDHGLYLHSTNTTIINNVFHGIISGWGVQTASGFSGLIANNTFTDTRTVNVGQLMLWDPDGAITVRNNIFYNPPGGVGVTSYTFSSPSCVVDHNIVYGGSIGSPSGCTFSNNTVANPLFISTTANDFHLQAGSPAINTGMSVPSITTDFDGNARPQGGSYDIGAFEYGQTSGAAAPVITSAAVANGQVGAVFSYQISASNSPTVYNATGLPAGLSVNSSTGAISGSPVAAGTFSIALSAGNGTGTGTATLSISISSAPVTTPVISISPAPLSFGGVQVGTSSPIQFITVTNIGALPYAISNEVMPAGDFAFGGIGTCNLGVPISAGKSCTISVKFTPTVVGARTGSVVVTDNSLGSPRTLNLSGTGTAAADTLPPSIPLGLVASAVSPSTINLFWATSTDNVAVAGYRIYRGGVQVGTTAANSYSDTGLTAGTAYTYAVSAYDGADNSSGQSVSVGATTQSIFPVIKTLVGSDTTANTIYLSWSTDVPTDGRILYGLTSFYGASSALLDNITRTTTHSAALTNLAASTLYHFKVVSTDSTGRSVSSPDFTFTTLAQGGNTVYIPAVPGLPSTGGAPVISGNVPWYTIIILLLLMVFGSAVAMSRKK